MTADETRTALEAAIRAHVAEEGDGAYLTDWILVAAAAAPDDVEAHTYVMETSHSPAHVRIGLARYAALTADRLIPGDDE